MDDRLSVERLWFSNTLLLGFDAAQNEKKHRVAFSHDMFKNPNVKGMEVVLHFLLSQLYPTRLNELLKYVWPINDQTQGKQYRQIIANLLQELKDKLDLPPIVSTLQSCSGKRFYDLLWKLSYYTLQTSMQKNFPDYAMPTFPVVDTNTSLQKLQDLATALKLHIARQSRIFVSHAQRAVTSQENWKQFDKKMYDEYTVLTAELAALKKEHEELAAKFDLTHLNDVETQEKRKKRIDDTRKMWQVAEDFNTQVTNNKEAYSDILSGNAYPHQLSTADLHIDKIPEELATVAAPLLLPATDDPQAPQFTLDGIITLFTSALSFLSHLLPPATPPLPICSATPRLSEWSKAQTLQLAAIEAFEAELISQVVAWRKELQEAMEVRASIDSALHRTDDDNFQMQPLPPPASYFDGRSLHEKREIANMELGFASPASRAPKQDVLEKLANSVRRVALRGSRTFAAIANELLPPDFASEDSQNFSISTMSFIDPDTFFAPPATPAPPVQQHSSTSTRKIPSTTQRQSIMNAPLYNKHPQPTPSTTYHPATKPKPIPKSYTSSKQATSKLPTVTPYATNDGSAPNFGSLFTQQKPEPPSTKNKTMRSTLPPTSSTSTSVSTSTTTTSTSPSVPPAAKKATHKRVTTKSRPRAMDLLVHDLASYIGGSEMVGQEEMEDTKKSSKPKPSGLRTAPTTQTKTPKKKLAWAETSDDWLHSHTNTLDAIEGTAFQTTKQLPRTPLRERTKQPTHTTPKVTHTIPDEDSPANFFEDKYNGNGIGSANSLFSEDVEWNQFINNSPKSNKNNPKSSHTPTTSTSHPNGNKNYVSPQRTSKPHDELDSMDYDIGSPMHMTDWLTSAADNEQDTDSLFSTFSTNLSFSNDLPKDKDQHKARSHEKNNNNSIFATPADEFS